MKHTPGPWTVVRTSGLKSYLLLNNVSSELEAMANERLISAAPDLLLTGAPIANAFREAMLTTDFSGNVTLAECVSGTDKVSIELTVIEWKNFLAAITKAKGE